MVIYSGFSPLKMVDLSIAMLVYQRVNGEQMVNMMIYRSYLRTGDETSSLRKTIGEIIWDTMGYTTKMVHNEENDDELFSVSSEVRGILFSDAPKYASLRLEVSKNSSMRGEVTVHYTRILHRDKLKGFEFFRDRLQCFRLFQFLLEAFDDDSHMIPLSTVIQRP